MADTASAPPLILASGSQTRRSMLARAGIEVEVVPAAVDEKVLREALVGQDPSAGPTEIAAMLARAKAEHVSFVRPDSLVIGSDQVLALDRVIISKPTSREAARQNLMRMRGKTHELHSSVALAQAGNASWGHTQTARLTMRSFSPEFLEMYLDLAGETVLGSSGAYQVESAGIQLFECVEGDHFVILGMPLLALLAELRTRGIVAT